MTMTKQAALKRLLSINKSGKRHDCPVCGQPIATGADPDDWEYVKTKRGSEIFIHTECVKRWSE